MTRLLVVDDDAASCRLVSAIFAAEAIDVAVAGDGAGGLASIAELAPDAVLLDVRLPDLDGLEVLQRVRATADAPPVIMLTAEHDVKLAIRAIQLGAFDY